MKLKYLLLTFMLSLALAITPAFAGVSTPSAKSMEEITEERIFHRAKESVFWSQPVIGVAMTLKAIEDNGGNINDIAYLSKPGNWKWRILTPNSQSLYVTSVLKTSAENPLVIEVPARSKRSDIFGTIMDSFQVPLADVGSKGEDLGKGGKYLILPSDFKGAIPDGYIPVKSQRNITFFNFRIIPASFSEADLADARQVIQGIKSYTLNEPSKQGKHIDVYDKMFDTVEPQDDSYFDILTSLLNKETVINQDLIMMEMMRSFGYQYGQKFAPSKATRQLLSKARYETLNELVLMARNMGPNLWKGKTGWIVPVKSIGPKSKFTFKTATELATDARAETYATYCCGPAKLGSATAYILSTRDTNGVALQADSNYKLHVPANVPVNQFWALTAYNARTAVFFEHVKRTSVSSLNDDVQFNNDGSVDLYVGPVAPKGKESNWINTHGLDNSIFLFRFYGPEKGLRDGSWQMNGLTKY